MKFNYLVYNQVVISTYHYPYHYPYHYHYEVDIDNSLMYLLMIVVLTMLMNRAVLTMLMNVSIDDYYWAVLTMLMNRYQWTSSTDDVNDRWLAKYGNDSDVTMKTMTE